MTSKDDAYYESLIPKLYRPIKKESEEPVKEPVFVVEAAPDPEPVEQETESIAQPSISERIRRWLMGIVQETVE